MQPLTAHWTLSLPRGVLDHQRQQISYSHRFCSHRVSSAIFRLRLPFLVTLRSSAFLAHDDAGGADDGGTEATDAGAVTGGAGTRGAGGVAMGGDSEAETAETQRG